MGLVEKAEAFATKCHEGVFRKNPKERIPYIEHPKAVVNNLIRYGYANDEVVLSVGWLHDVVEDCEDISFDDILREFGRYIAEGVEIMSRTGDFEDRAKYKSRLMQAPTKFKMVKLCDFLDNSRTIESLKPKSIRKYLKDAYEFYIPMARDVCPALSEEIRRNVENDVLKDYLERYRISQN